ncbi:hypothetical protein DT23_15055 [Thioclava indica]|uniref:Uncharacterized protein n=1 Tax=Thioclava indica TaxID=1353528 RepID=A0A074JWG4_9RHOB|nr:hypothetical protein DT23_15055 [Thioclava indica]
MWKNWGYKGLSTRRNSCHDSVRIFNNSQPIRSSKIVEAFTANELLWLCFRSQFPIIRKLFDYPGCLFSDMRRHVLVNHINWRKNSNSIKAH